jgi:hypothetical protein
VRRLSIILSEELSEDFCDPSPVHVRADLRYCVLNVGRCKCGGMGTDVSGCVKFHVVDGPASFGGLPKRANAHEMR